MVHAIQEQGRWVVSLYGDGGRSTAPPFPRADLTASVRLGLRGTWTPRPGAIVPLDPWKHDGAVTSVGLNLWKQTSRWEPGDWTIMFFDPPWVENRIVE